MYLFRGMNGFSWYTKVISKDLNTNAEREGYINFTFKKGCDPKPEELNDKNAYEGELYFHDKNGNIRKVFPIVNEFGGKKSIEYKILGIEGNPQEANKEPAQEAKKEPVQTIRKEENNFGTSYADIKSEDLPFY